MKNYLSILPIALVLSLFHSPFANAISVSLEGGMSMTSGTAFDGYNSSGSSGSAAVRMSLFPNLELGAFYKGGTYGVDNLSDGKLGTSFYGGSIQANIPIVFIEGRVGVFKFDLSNANQGLAYSGTIGKNLFSLGFAKIAAVASYQTAPYENGRTGAKASGSLMDFGLRLTAGF